MGSEVQKLQLDDDEDAERKNSTCEPKVEYEAEHNNNEISSIMDKQYVTRFGGKMRARKRKFDLTQKIGIHPTINNKVKRSKIQHANSMVQTMENTHLDLRYYARLHATIH